MNDIPLRQMASRKTFFLTKSGLDSLKERLDNLLQERVAIRERLRTMDMQEKMESSVSADEMNMLEFAETESTEIADILQNVELIKKTKHPTSIQLGSKATLSSGSEPIKYTLVSPNEVDPFAGKISPSSPLGRALVGKKLHESVQVTTPKGKKYFYKILAIE
jgi:transcription elongation GreA/GreB family factor